MNEAMFDIAHWALPKVLSAQARALGDHPFVVFTEGGQLSYRQADDDAHRVAAFLRDLGVKPGDRVLVMVPNSLDFIRIWTGIARLGATMVALNTQLSGPMLESQVVRSRASCALIGAACAEAFVGILPNAQDIRTVVAVGGRAGGDFPGVEHRDFEKWRSRVPYDGPEPAMSDIACLLYTSGTTGPSKGVLLPHAHCFLMGLGMAENCRLTPEDRFYVVLPLFHVNGLFLQVYAALIGGSTVILRERFSASNWLADVRRFGATVTSAVAAVTSFVFSLPTSAEERRHALRLVMTGPNLPEQARTWQSRFAIPEVLSAYGMTECGIPTWGRLGEGRPGSVGKVYSRYYDLQIVHPETDMPVDQGGVGEIVVRPKVPFGFMAGYDGMPEKTVEATRNLWFHTGDAGRMDKDGHLYFVDRLGDRIRRRGENISSFEVEDAIERLEGLAEVAAFAVPTDIDDGEDEMMVAVVLAEGTDLGIEEIADFAVAILPKFSRPRYIEIVDALPRTNTHKVQKRALRVRGLTARTWDVKARAYVRF